MTDLQFILLVLAIVCEAISCIGLLTEIIKLARSKRRFHNGRT